MEKPPFKSERAAKLAFTKAEKAYVATLDAYNAANHAGREKGFNDEIFAAIRKAEDAKKAAYDAAEGVYKKVRAEGYFVKSWYFGTNPTRDLIAANMD